jgi:hypothetical protein
MSVIERNFDDLTVWGDEKQPRLIGTEYELFLNAPIDLCWQRMVHEVDGWWAHCYKPGSTVIIEPFPGGRWWERFADGVNGSLWGHVVYIEPPRILKVVGQFALPGVSNSAGIWRFEAQEGGTLLKSSGEMFGALDFETMKQRKGGTATLLRALVNFIENGERVSREA